MLWLFDYGIESGISALVNDRDKHNEFYTEQDANERSFKYLAQHNGLNYAKSNWDIVFNPFFSYNQSKNDYYDMSDDERQLYHKKLN